MQTNLHSQGEQVLLRELQVVVITKPPQHGPCGLVPTSLYEEGVQEEEACNLKKKKEEKSGHNLRERVNTDSDSTNYVHKATKYEKHIKTKEERGSVRPLSVSPLSLTPSIMFLLTTFFTSSNAWGASGVLKHVLYMHTQHICSFQMLLL